MIRAACLFVAAVFAFQSAVCWATTVALLASKDNSLFGNNINNSNGGGAGVFVGTTNTTQDDSLRRGLIEFDIASIVPAGATIADVKLRMYLGQASMASGVRTIDLHRLKLDWGEGTAGSPPTSVSGTGTGFPASAGDATWNQRFYLQTDWTEPGAEGDYVSAISASTDVGTTLDAPYEWVSTPTLVSDVQGWLDQPTTNDGWIIIDHVEHEHQTVKGFYSRNATEKNSAAVPLPAGWNPTLTITYVNGDYNGNGVVDAADYVIWRNTLNQSVSPAGSGADGDPSGTIDDGDYTYWRARFGNAVSGPGAGGAVPEPSSGLLLIAVGILAFLQRGR